MKSLELKLKNCSYPIYIGKDLLVSTDLVKEYMCNDKQILIITNKKIANLFDNVISQYISLSNVKLFLIEDGEQYKNIDTFNKVINFLISNNYERSSSLLVALGGGVVGDLTGFVAACYQRGVDFIQIPTTLLAQVDSSVGGKTGVNHHLAKNMIGAFYHPKCVIADTSFLVKLPDREFFSGIAEVIKYSLIYDENFFIWLSNNINKLLKRDHEVLTEAIFKSCYYKSQIVKIDELERNLRAILNLGHTFAHAIETCTNYKCYLHGEAVSIGIVMASKLSYKLGLLSLDSVNKVIDLLERANLPVKLNNNLSKDELWQVMLNDKKNINGKVRFVLLEKIGKAKIVNNINKDDVISVL